MARRPGVLEEAVPVNPSVVDFPVIVDQTDFATADSPVKVAEIGRVFVAIQLLA
jgi:hypothetical protein